MVDEKRGTQEALFEKIGDKYLWDKKNHLLWRIKPEESGEVFTWQEAVALAWQEAKKNAKYLWRLPTVEELSHLVKVDPTVDPTTGAVEIAGGLITGDTHWYWTSTTFAGGSARAWVVGFGGGRVYRDTRVNSRSVRLCCVAVSD